VTAVDVSAVPDIVVRGYVATGVQTARADLQPLLIAYGIEVAEQDGFLRFYPRKRAGVKDVARETLVRRADGVVERQRAPEPEVAGRVLIQHVDADGDFQTRVGEAVQAGTRGQPIMSSELPVALTTGEGTGLAERFLAEARIARDVIDLVLPPSRDDVVPGDLLRIDGGDEVWRVDRINEGDARQVEAVRTELHVYEPSDVVEVQRVVPRPQAPMPVDAVFLDLPLLTGEEVPHAPWIAATAVPWPEAVSLFASDEGTDWRLNRQIETSSTVGTTETALRQASSAIWDRGAELVVRFPDAALASVSDRALLAGANVAAIGSASGGPWEVFQFRDARLLAPGRWALSMRLRGQRGTEAVILSDWPVGSVVVVLDGAPQQIDLRPDLVGVARHYRYGPAALPVDHETFATQVRALGGAGLAPYAPVHLRWRRVDGDNVLSWVRRSRLPTDGWGPADVPLGEAFERYAVSVADAAGAVVSTFETERPEWLLDASMDAQVRAVGASGVTVAQISDVHGPGHRAHIGLP
jgi:hypothetical protein